MKKLICGLLVACLLCLMIPSVSAASMFQDVGERDWFFAATQYCAMRELMVGIDENHFSPGTVMDRGMFISVLYRMAGKPETQASHSFTDVSSDAYYADAVCWAAANGIAYGATATTFAPQQMVTREQAACFVARFVTEIDAAFLRGDSIAPSFADETLISPYAKASVALVGQFGLMCGDDTGAFLPQKAMTRAECAAVLMQLDFKLIPAGLLTQDPTGQNTQLECELTYEDTVSLRNVLNQSGWEKDESPDDLEQFEVTHILILDGVMYLFEASADSDTQTVVYINLFTNEEGIMTDKTGELVRQILDILNSYTAD